MCVIIDTCVLSCVFSKSNAKHKDYSPVLDWILKKKGFIVYGGSKYIQELGQGKHYKIFALLKESHKVFECDCSEVDKITNNLIKNISDPDFDDPHLIALAQVSKCRIICTDDLRAHKFLSKKYLYPEISKRPKIYNNSRQKNILNDKNIPKKYKKYIKVLNSKIANNIISSLV